MTFAFAQRLATVLTAATAFVALAAGGNLNPIFVVLWLAACAYSLRIPDGRFPGRFIAPAALLVLPVMIVLALRGLDPVLAAAYFASLLLLARLVARDGPEAHAQTHLLSVLVLAGGAAASADVTYLVAFVAYVFALTWALLLNQLHREAGPAALALPTREVVGPGLPTGVFALTTAALFATAVTFVVFPRTTFGLGLRRPMGGGSVGLSDRITLSGFGRLKENNRVVMRAEAEGGGADLERTYWRAHVLELYDGRGWSALRRDIAPDGSRMAWLRRGGGGALQDVRVEMISDLGSGVLPVPDHTLRVSMGMRDGRGDLAAVRRVGPSEVRTVGRLQTPFHYHVYVDPGLLAVDDRPPQPEEITVPKQSVKVQALAARLFGEAKRDPDAYAARLETYLSTTYGYTTELPGDDPSLDHFLFDRRRGHCEYFATAMAVLLRLEHVPARVVTGFYGASWNASGGYWVVRQGSAHAWVEAWRDGVGWVRYDPTPEAGRGDAAADTLASRLSDAWDAMQARWSSWVLDFDLRTQWFAFVRLRHALRRLGDAFAGRGSRLGLTRGILVALSVLILGYLVVLRLRRAAAGVRRRERTPASVRRASAAYRELLRVLAAQGIDRAPGETAEELLAKVRVRQPALLPRVEAVVRRYEAVRFGGRGLGREEARALKARVRDLATQLRRAA